MNEKLEIIRAGSEDYYLLTNIAFRAKRHWPYPDEYFTIWKDELTITREYIKNNLVWMARINAEVVGFYSIVENPADFFAGEVWVMKGYWLEHIFIQPEFHGKGIGKALIGHAMGQASDLNTDRLLVFSDPFAKGFYEKVGARFLYDSKSSIPGRMIPVFQLAVI